MNLLTEAEAAERMRVSKTTLVTKLIHAPGFPVVRMPGVRRVFVDADGLDRWLEAQKPSAPR